MCYQLSDWCGQLELNLTGGFEKAVSSMILWVTPTETQESSSSHQLLTNGCSQKQGILNISRMPFLRADHSWRSEKTPGQKEAEAKSGKLVP